MYNRYINKVVALNEVYIELSQKKEAEFIDRALRIWDRMTGICPEWREFLRDYVLRSWYELCRRN